MGARPRPVAVSGVPGLSADLPGATAGGKQWQWQWRLELNVASRGGIFAASHRSTTIGIIVAMTLVAFEGIAVATVMPVVGRELNGLQIYSWAFSAYVGASLVGMVSSGVWSDRIGPRHPFVLGAIIFGTGALLSGSAPTMGWLIVGRGIQGLGGGALIVALYVVIGRGYDERLRPKAFSVLSAAWVIPALVGPVVAGWLTEVATWRWAFWLVPVVIIWPLVALRPALITHSGGTGERGRSSRPWWALTAAVGLTGIQVGLVRPAGVSPWLALIAGVVGFGLLLPAARILLPAGALRLARGLPTTVVMRGILAGTFFASEAFLPLALVQLRGVSVTWAGLTLAVASAGWIAGSAWQSRLPGEVDRARAVQLGTSLVAVGLATLPLCLIPALPVWTCVGSWLIGALGMGLCFPSINVQTLRLSAKANQGRNSSGLQISDAIFTAVGLGVAGAIHSAGVVGGGADRTTYTVMWLIAAVIAGIAALVVARRITPVVQDQG